MVLLTMMVQLVLTIYHQKWWKIVAERTTLTTQTAIQKLPTENRNAETDGNDFYAVNRHFLRAIAVNETNIQVDIALVHHNTALSQSTAGQNPTPQSLSSATASTSHSIDLIRGRRHSSCIDRINERHQQREKWWRIGNGVTMLPISDIRILTVRRQWSLHHISMVVWKTRFSQKRLRNRDDMSHRQSMTHNTVLLTGLGSELKPANVSVEWDWRMENNWYSYVEITFNCFCDTTRSSFSI